MKNKALFSAIVLLSAASLATAQSSNTFKATDRFLGVHFDFHANPDTKGIGKTLRNEDVAYMLNSVKPDYIQVDTKGHPGISSYPTTVGIAAPEIEKDPLKIFREETAKRGIGLFSHYSGVLDAQAVKDHPDWARINANGKADAGATSIFSKYADDYFIPQLKELNDKYHINGVWVDGDCWALQPDYSTEALVAYKKYSGKDIAPHSRKDADWPDYVQFTRYAFRQYLYHYFNAVHKNNPKFLITSNWSFSSFMPGMVDESVDYLSGDFTSDAVPDVNFEARALAPQGKPWDLMAWGFMSDKNGKGFYWKTARQLAQKAALVLSQGGGYQVYVPQKRDASLQLEMVPTLTEVSKFAHERKAYCYQTTPIPQVALLLSAYGHYNESPGVFENGQGGNNNVKGTLAMLLNSQYSVQLLQEHHLQNTLANYPILVISEWKKLQPEFVIKIENYVREGGKVLAIGDKHIFGNALPESVPAKIDNIAGVPVRMETYGKGTIACIDDNMSLRYSKTGNDTLRQAVADIVKKLFPDPKVTVSGSARVQVTINRKNKTTLIHLVNVDDHFDTLPNNQLDFKLPAITSLLSISVKMPAKPLSVKVQPGNKAVPFSYANGRVKFHIDGVDIYSIVEIK
jgi:hypothetical protein